VNGDGRGDQRAERRAVAERDADPDPLCEGVQGHNADDHQRAERIRAAQRAEVHVSVLSELTAGDEDEGSSERDAGECPRGARANALPEETDAGADHEAGRDRGRQTHPAALDPSPEQERQGAEARREGRQQRSEEDSRDAHRPTLG
jgi:hypothetical protein